MNLRDKPYEYFHIPESHKVMLSKLFEDVLYELEKLKIDSWCDGGTLLGFQRHNTFLPHDDDIDLGVMNGKDFNTVVAKFPELMKKYGYFTELGNGMFKIGIQDQWIIRGPKDHSIGTPTLDIFEYKLKQDIIKLNSVLNSRQWPGAYHLKRDFYPLRKITVGKTFVYTPNDPIPYLNRMYPNWQTEVHVQIRKPPNSKETNNKNETLIYYIKQDDQSVEQSTSQSVEQSTDHSNNQQTDTSV